MTIRNRQLVFGVLLVFSSLILLETRDFNQATAQLVDLTNVHKVIALPLAVIYFAGNFVLRGIPKRLSQFQYGYFVYIALGFVSSIFYSQEILFSLWKLFEVSTVLLLSVFVSATCLKRPISSFEFYELCLLFLKFLLIVTAIGALLNPVDAFRSTLTDESMEIYGTPLVPYQIFGTLLKINPNSLGAVAAILIFVYVRRYIRGCRNFISLSWILFSTAFFILSQSRTAFAGLIFAFVITTLVDRKIKIYKKLFLGFLIALVIVFFSGYFIQYLTRGYETERLLTLSGRMVWWEVAFQQYLNADMLVKFIGLGFASGSRAILSEKLDAGGAATLHSDYVDALMSSGAIGASILLIIMSNLLIKSYRYARSSHNIVSIEMLGILCILFVRSFTGTTIASHNLFLILVFAIAIYLQVSAHQNRGASDFEAIKRIKR